MSLVILCPGQGGQHPHMFDRIKLDRPHAHPAALALLQQADTLLGRPAAEAAADERRFQNAIAQPLVCAGALSHWLALRDDLPAPTVVAGYSAGELAAHAVAGSLRIEDCLPLAATRAGLMDAASPADAGLRAVLGLPLQDIEQLCRQHGAWPAIVNGPDHVVVGGRAASLQAIEQAATAAGARVVAIPVCVPAHTPLLQAAAAPLADALDLPGTGAPAVPLLAGTTGRRVLDRAGVITTLAAQVHTTVRWSAVIEQAVERGGRVFLELGPGRALSRRVLELQPRLQARSVEDFQTLQGVAEWVQGACART